MGEVARLMTEIRARKFSANEIAERINSKVEDIKKALSAAVVAKPEDLRLSMIAEISADLEKLQKRYLELQREIEILEKELQ